MKNVSDFSLKWYVYLPLEASTQSNLFMVVQGNHPVILFFFAHGYADWILPGKQTLTVKTTT